MGGWTTIMNKVSKSAVFNEPMKTYINGFGNVSVNTNYWLGLANMFDLTNREQMSVRIELANSEFDRYFIEYDLFLLGPQIEKFKLTLGNKVFGTIRESFSYHNNMKFTTIDEDNDINSTGNCAEHLGGWWFAGLVGYGWCYSACLTCEESRMGQWLMNEGNRDLANYHHYSNIKMLIRPRSL